MQRQRDAEAELNLPPGFRFHPTDEELVVHYLCRKIAYQTIPVPIFAEIDLYQYNPWQLPDMALFGTKEWYFFTPRDRKYPNGSRPNRGAGSGYWKATGADKPITPAGSAKHVGIKKALVFYAGKAPKGLKTDWIMHEYRLAEPNRANKGSLRLDEWVLCRIYNKKNNWQRSLREIKKDELSVQESESLREIKKDELSVQESESLTSESDVDNDSSSQSLDFLQPTMKSTELVIEDNDWLMDLNLDDLQSSVSFGEVPVIQDYSLLGLGSPHFKPYQNNNLLPFWST